MGAFVLDWLNGFSFSVGFFTVFICGFLDAVYLTGETEIEEVKRYLISKTRNLNIGAFVSGALVFLAARAEHIPLAEWIFGNGISATAIISALLSLFLFWYLLHKRKTWWVRIIAAFQVTMILVAVTYSHFPNIMLLRNGDKISLTDAANSNTITALGWALVIGSIFILPAFFYLIYSFDEKAAKPGSGEIGEKANSMTKELRIQHTISTDRLNLEIVSVQDADFIMSLVNSKGWMENIGDRNIHSKGDALVYIDKILGTQDFFYWVARIKETNTPIGIISFLKRSYLENFDIGFAFLPDFNNKGYAYEAASAVLTMLSKLPEYDVVLATTLFSNRSSIKLLTKLGFRFKEEVENGTVHIYTNAP